MDISLNNSRRTTTRLKQSMAFSALLFAFLSGSTVANDYQSPNSQRIATLLQEQDAPPLIEHHRALLESQQAQSIAEELLSLKHGPAWQIDTQTFLSTRKRQNNGETNLINAYKLGQWLGSMELALQTQNLSNTDASQWFASLLDIEEQMLSAGPIELQTTSKHRTLVNEIRKGIVSLPNALQRLAYGNVESSSIIAGIEEGIKFIEQQVTP